MSALEISRLQSLFQLAECLADRIRLLRERRRGGTLGAIGRVMVMVSANLLAGALLNVLLKIGEILLRSR